MASDEVLRIVSVLRAAGAAFWIDGGWGVDALLARQTREHSDLDVVVRLDQVDLIVRSLVPEGFGVSENYLPTRAVLRAENGRQIDLHPVSFDASGDGWQSAAAPDGSDCVYPAVGFTTGVIDGTSVPCLSAELQLAHHTGYPRRDKDRLDMARLTAAFNLPSPDASDPSQQ